MAKVIVTFNIMAESPDTDLSAVEVKVKELVKSFAGDDFKLDSDFKSEIVDVAFGLKALDIKVILDEGIGSTETLEKDLTNIENVKSVEVKDVRRIIGWS